MYKVELSAYPNTHVRRVIDAVNQTGQHVLIYGERGVGKTSLANVIDAFLAPFTSEVIQTCKFNCFRDSTFADIWNAFFNSLETRLKSPAVTGWRGG